MRKNYDIRLAVLREYLKSLSADETSNYQRLLDFLFEQPFIKRTDIEKMLGVSNPTAGNIIETFCQLGILHDCSPQKSRNKTYAFAEYLNILERGTELS